MRPSPGLVAAVERYLRFRSAAEVLKPMMNRITREVMAAFHPRYATKHGEPRRGCKSFVGEIHDPDDLFLMDEAQWPEFYELLDHAKRVAGFDGFPVGHCPALISQTEMIRAENAIIQECAKLPGLAKLAQVSSLDDRKHLIEITLKWVVPHVKSARINAIPLPFTCHVKGV